MKDLKTSIEDKRYKGILATTSALIVIENC
jgi:hypothetical protein